ncbi:MAG: Cobalt-containing nitrile hydratase subunit alpha [Alphaproteobacteria bacterium MarineAlpha4_Bin2]|nr:MAG: Cobalt-containing nitrile hydratase subunit alpha [Alphaproteobacteria bacterium MarineAlpha4_Bin2]
MNEHHGHEHPKQPDLEDQPITYYKIMTEALAELLIEKGVITADEMRKQMEQQDSRSPIFGAKLIARAWTDKDFKKRLIANVNAAAAEMDIDAGDIPIRGLENTDEIHNVVVCTLCSCYPRSLIGLPPDWYKSRAYRSRTVREPRTVLAEFGTKLPNNTDVRVHDSTADLRFLVIPKRPEGTNGMNEAELAELITRDSMIGVSIAKAPT